MMVRRCRCCGVEKPLIGNYYKDSQVPGGYMWQCIDCKREAQRRYAQTEKGRLAMLRKFARKQNVEPDKLAARTKLQTAVSLGKIRKPTKERANIKPSAS